MNAVIMSFHPNEKQSVICEMRAVESDSVTLNQLGKLKISCTRPVKERQKFVSELCIGRRMASMRESRDSDRF